jgi:hypothetical protein
VDESWRTSETTFDPAWILFRESAMRVLSSFAHRRAFLSDCFPKKTPILKCPQEKSNNNIEIKIITERHLLIQDMNSDINVDRF